ncbi:MAG: prolyl-tRNA synthetase [Candidatus Pacebacteria bacterium]|nr:prolyl-tRNA synthetase [Candidatus Paceibacterota bacterium]MBP9772716.1 prolyl-tRNA synthetase [Candidatus Paceibacterota bacterium]QQR76698.1 MAG: prolyl-tRNA synthetase [Candidatus Nomurabacteria bacterium]
MKQSQLFTKTKKESPADEVAKNAELLIKGGFVEKVMAGVYGYLPLGLRVLKKIENIIREEMNAIGGQEITLTALQEKSTWEPTNQWADDQVDVWFKTKLKNETELGLGVTHEAPMTIMMKDFVQSYRDLPRYVYQFQTKFRNETRAKSGIMRTREFVMKDLYSFSKDEAEHNEFYERSKVAYKNIFNRTGIGHLTYMTFASGGMFSKFSHEFQTITGAGEDTIYVDESKGIAINKEVYTDEIIESLGLSKDTLVENRAVEVGNIFTLGTRFSDALGLKYQTETGESKSAFMGSYGIGPARLMGTVVEVLSDDRGIIWPESIAPFRVHLLVLGDSEDARAQAENLYQILNKNNVEVLFDDRSGVSAGEKFADADLIGIPYRLVVSDRSIKDGGVEIKKRNEEKGSVVAFSEVIEKIK